MSNPMRSIGLTLALVALAAMAPRLAQAAESYDNCSGFIDSVPATITTQGVWCLRADLSTAISSGIAIEIATNNVTIDCNGFKLGGLGAGPGTNATGIESNSRLNSVVRNCNIRGFYVGIFHGGDGGGHLVEGSRFDGIKRIAIQFNAPNSTARDNYVFDTGGVNSAAFGIVLGPQGGDAIGNTISGLTTTNLSASVYGVWYYSQSEGSISNNRIRGLAAGASGTAFGIFGTAGAQGTMIHDNIMHGPGTPGSVGIRCDSNRDTAMRNGIRGFATPIQTCQDSGNVTNLN